MTEQQIRDAVQVIVDQIVQEAQDNVEAHEQCAFLVDAALRAEGARRRASDSFKNSLVAAERSK